MRSRNHRRHAVLFVAFGAALAAGLDCGTDVDVDVAGGAATGSSASSSSSAYGSSATSTTTTSTTTTSASASSGGGGGECSAPDVPPPGATITIHVHNAGSATRGLALNCGSAIPIELDTATGTAHLGLDTGGQDCGPGDGSCEQYLAGKPLLSCETDCGNGVGDSLPPGATVDFTWNHVGRTMLSLPDACVTVEGASPVCELAVAFAPTPQQTGRIDVCSTDEILVGTCQDASISQPFTIDTTQSEVTIEVM